MSVPYQHRTPYTTSTSSSHHSGRPISQSTPHYYVREQHASNSSRGRDMPPGRTTQYEYPPRSHASGNARFVDRAPSDSASHTSRNTSTCAVVHTDGSYRNSSSRPQSPHRHYQNSVDNQNYDHATLPRVDYIPVRYPNDRSPSSSHNRNPNGPPQARPANPPYPANTSRQRSSQQPIHLPEDNHYVDRRIYRVIDDADRVFPTSSSSRPSNVGHYRSR